MHFTETCDEQLPHLITHVVTTDATKTEVEQTEAIHQALAWRDLLPETHLVDAGYVDAELVLESQQRYGVTLRGPVSQNNQWQAREGQGYDLASFTIEWQENYAVCPEAQTEREMDRANRSTWTPRNCYSIWAARLP